MTNPKWLKVAAQRSVQHSWTLGYVFAQYRKYEGKSAEDLAARLNCSLEVLDWLSVCRRPAPERFEEQLELLEKRFAVEAYLLAEVINRVGVDDVLSASGEAGELIDDEPVLLAARDHTSDDETDS